MAGSTIKVGMDVGDVKAAGLELIRLLQGQVDATLQLADAQVKYNKEGKEVANVLKGVTEAGDRHTVTLKQTAAGYELLNAQVVKAKTSMTDLARAQKEAEATAKAEAKAQEQAAAALAKRVEALNNQGKLETYRKQFQQEREDQRGPSRFDGGRGGNSVGGFFSGPGPNGPGSGPPGGLDDMEKKTNKAREAGERLFITWQGVVRLIEAQVVKRAIGAVVTAFDEAVDSAKKFSIAVAEIRTISQDMPQSTEKWRAELTKLSSAFGVTQADVANAAYETLSNQIARGPEVVNFLSTALKFGAATVTSTTDSVNLLSSAIKSFNLPVEDAERIAAIFFKTIDLGRVRAREMADTFGRIGAVANQAGVTLEEVSAAIATITIRGVKFNDASTIITNVLNKLIKPTDEMKKLFTEWGVASGEAAIQTFGFEGVLARLNEESKKGTARIGELFNQIRALRGAFQLSGQGFADYQENLRKITQGQKEYNAAAKEVMSSPGKQLDVALQKVKNYFTEDFGQKVVQGLVDFNKWFESAAEKADGLERSVKLVVKTLTAGLSILALWKAAVIANTLASLGWSTVFQKLTYDAVVFGRTLATAAPFLAAFAIGYATMNAIQNGNDIGRSRQDIVADLEAKQAARREEAAKKLSEQDPERDATQKLKQSLDTRYQFLLNYSTGAVKLSNDLKQRTIDQYKDITDHVKVSSKTYFDSIINKMSVLRKEASEADALIKSSYKQTEDLGRRTTQAVFGVREKYASEGRLEYQNGAATIVDNQKVELLQNRIAALLVEARLKAKEGTKEAFEESRKLYDDVQKLKTQLFEAKTTAEKRVFDDDVERGLKQPSRLVFDAKTGELKAQYDFIAKTGELEKDLLQLGKERLGNERQFRELQRQRAAAAEAEIAREKERLRGLQQAFSEIEKIEVFTKEGKVKEEYKKDPGLAARQFDEQSAKIRGLAGSEAFGTQYTVFQDLQKQKLALVQQVENAIRAEQAATIQQNLIRTKEGTQKLVDNSTQKISESRKVITDGMDKLERDLAVIEERTLRPQLAKLQKIPFTDIEITRGGDTMLKKWTGLDLGNSGGFEKAEPDRQAAVQALKAVREAQAAFNADQTVAKLEVVKQKLGELKEAAAKYIKTFTGRNPENITEQGDAGLTQGDRLKGLDAGVDTTQKGLQTAAQAQAQLAQAKEIVTALDLKIKGLPGGVEFFAKGVQEHSPVINQGFQEFTKNALDLTRQIEQLNSQLDAAASKLPQIRGNRNGGPQVEGNFFGGPPKYFAFGGPVGSDRVPAWLGEDEYVMTGAATKAFAPLLKQMNAYPSRAGASGASVTTVGDININVNGGNTSAQTINEIGAGLRRAVARGTVKLHS